MTSLCYQSQWNNFCHPESSQQRMTESDLCFESEKSVSLLFQVPVLSWGNYYYAVWYVSFWNFSMTDDFLIWPRQGGKRNKNYVLCYPSLFMLIYIAICSINKTNVIFGGFFTERWDPIFIVLYALSISRVHCYLDVMGRATSVLLILFLVYCRQTWHCSKLQANASNNDLFVHRVLYSW